MVHVPVVVVGAGACGLTAAPAMDELARHGLMFEVPDGFLCPGRTAHRMLTLPERTGVALVAARGVSGNDVSGDLSGNGLLSAVVGGYLAAGTAAAHNWGIAWMPQRVRIWRL